MRETSWLGVLVCVIGLSGCTVYSTRPLGMPVWSEMQGTWQIEDAFYEVRLLPDGSLSMAWIEWDHREEQFSLGKGELVVTVDEGATYWNIRDARIPEEYRFLRALFLEPEDAGGDPDVALFAPNGSGFEKAIKEGLLKEGLHSGKNIDAIFLVDDSRLADFVDPQIFAQQFDVENPVLARRIIKTNPPHSADTVLHRGQQAHMECLPDAAPQWLGADVRGQLQHLRSYLEKQFNQPIEMPDPATEQWAKFLNIDPEQWGRLIAPLPTPDSEERYGFDNEGVAIGAKLSPADFSSYLTCLDSQGFGLVNVSNLQDDAGYGSFWIAKDGFGLFRFIVEVE